jgi:hypothetical protein
MVSLRIPLLCKEGLGEVESGIERRECYAVNIAIDKATPPKSSPYKGEEQMPRIES